MTDRLYMLAFDHRRSLIESFFGIDGDPSPDDEAKARLLKRIVWDGLRRSLGDGLPRDRAGALVDVTYGREVLASAARDGVRVAVPVEASGGRGFAFEVPEWRERLAEIDPAWAKVLVRYNPDGDAELNARQRRPLVEVSDHCRSTGRGFLFELLVPPEPHQLDAAGGDAARYDRELRPALVTRAIVELQDAGIEPDIWKLEGLERAEDCETVAAAARADGRDRVGCVVLGRGADADAVDRWLGAGAGVPGFIGFAIGRSIWWEPMGRFFDGGATDEAEEAAASEIARRYLRFVGVFTEGAG